MVHETEVHAYAFILKELTEKKNWKKSQIYTQNQIRKIKPIVEQLGKTTPENIIKISENVYYVIEAKSKRSYLNIALKEARTCYADKINEHHYISSPFITGIAGNDDEGYVAISQFHKDGKWITITENNTNVTGLLSVSQIERILNLSDPHLKDIEISENEFLKTAEEINGILHENAIHKDYRARFISALLLALSEKTPINLDEAPMVLVDNINSKINLVLQKHKKSDFSRFIHIDKPSSEDNHVKLKTAIVKTIQELLALNIQSAMKSGKDILGRFYEVFLKYGNGAKEIGIVLTPRHITQFSVEVLDIQPEDLVLDVTCGTGGFLVAAFDEVRKKIDSEKDFEKFKKCGLYGIEEQDAVVSLAIVNMIFRGDGKNNIVEGNCFSKWVDTKSQDGEIHAVYLKEDDESRIPPITKVLMNPPFPKKKSDKKEFLFIEQALKQMQDDGVLFCVLPYSCMIKDGAYLDWRKRMLNEHSLLSVITFPEDLFYPVGVHTVGIIIKKGIPHSKKQNVFWVRATSDGLTKNKGKRLRSNKVENDLEKSKLEIKSFIKNPQTHIKNIPRMKKTVPIDFTDALLELIPEAYVDEPEPTINDIENGMEQLIRETAAFLVRHGKV